MTFSRSHEQDRARSYRNLQAAREKAAVKKNYDSAGTRAQLSDVFRARHGSDPHEWQLDVSEALLLGLDCVVISGTGTGKTMPFMMPLLLDDNKKTVVISPLKILQEDQAGRFARMKLPAAAVNGDSWSSQLQKGLKEGRYRGILTSPEMCLKHDPFRQVLTGSDFRDISMLVVDEAHCIPQWGGDFRTTYSEVGKLRSFFPSHIPVLATSATLTPAALHEVRSQLGIDADTSFFLNQGNDRPNIAFSTQTINSATDYEALRPLLLSNDKPRGPQDLVKSIVFVNSVAQAQHVAREIRSWLPDDLHPYVGYLHAHRTRQARRRAMRLFRKSKTKILIATEAAGMGADIPDIQQVIQFGVPSSLAVWIQRAGRAGRSTDINARAVLLVEKSMFQFRRKRKKTGGSSGDQGEDMARDPWEDDEGREGELNGEGDGGNAEETQSVVFDESIHEWCKKVDKDLRKWIVTEGCRRDVADEYFSNPPNRKPPTHICCDNCERRPVDVLTAPLRPSTPHSSPSISPHCTPSKVPDENNKRKMLTIGPRTRQRELLHTAHDALLSWRVRTMLARYSPSPITSAALLPDSILKSLASARYLQSIEDIKQHTGWAFAERHGEEVLNILKRVDESFFDSRAAAAAAKKAATAKRQEEERMRAREKQQQKMAERQAKEQQESERRQKQAEERERKKAEKEAREEARQSNKRLKRTFEQPLEGCSVFNLGFQSSSSPASSSSPFSMMKAHLMPQGTPLNFQAVNSTPLQVQTPLQQHQQQLSTPDSENIAPIPPERPRPRPRPRPAQVPHQTPHLPPATSLLFPG